MASDTGSVSMLRSDGKLKRIEILLRLLVVNLCSTIGAEMKANGGDWTSVFVTCIVRLHL